MEISSGHRHLPEDLEIEILTKLPVKSLVRFRCVSKRWMSLITNPRFVSMHLTSIKKYSGDPDRHQRHNSCGSGCVLGLEADDWMSIGGDGCRYFPYDFLKLYQPRCGETPYSIVGYCECIFCLSWRHLRRDISYLKDYHEWPFIALCNPALRELKVLPLSPTDYPPYKPPQVVDIGFGYDPKTKDYLVVKTVMTSSWDDSYRQVLNCIDVYSMKDSCWRTVSVRGDEDKYAAVQMVRSIAIAPGVYTGSGFYIGS